MERQRLGGDNHSALFHSSSEFTLTIVFADYKVNLTFPNFINPFIELVKTMI